MFCAVAGDPTLQKTHDSTDIRAHSNELNNRKVLFKGGEWMSIHRYRKSSTLALISLLLAGASALAQQPADPTRNLTPVTDAMLRNPPASDWLMWRRTFNGYGYSPLDQINKSNVKDLQVAWTWSL